MAEDVVRFHCESGLFLEASGLRISGKTRENEDPAGRIESGCAGGRSGLPNCETQRIFLCRELRPLPDFTDLKFLCPASINTGIPMSGDSAGLLNRRKPARGSFVCRSSEPFRFMGSRCARL